MNDTRPVGLDVAGLPRHVPRAFVPQDADLADAGQAVGLCEKLLERTIGSAEELERWLLDRSELESAVQQTSAVLYIRMTCQTDDEEGSEAYRHFIETVVPALKPISDKLDRKYLAEHERFPLDPHRYAVYDRAIRADVELFRRQNVPLQTEEALLAQEYQTVTGAMTVQFEGEERTLPQMRKFLLEPDRKLRQRAWRATAQRRLQDREKMHDLFDGMLQLRQRIAANAGFEDYQDYKFRQYHRFDYTPGHCRQFGDAVAELVVPVHDEIMKRRRGTMGLKALRPWDTAVDPEGRPPLRPFDDAQQLVDGCTAAFARTEPALGAQFAQMDAMGLLDLASRKGKAPGGYQETLSEARLPFIFMNAVGIDDDVRTLLHEGGHAFHAFAASQDPLLAYRHAPIEFCEVASMSMELAAGEHLSVFYEQKDLARSRREHLESIVGLLPWVATIDGFQDWIYSHPDHSRGERRDAWLALRARFGGTVVDWKGLDEELASQWHRQLHIFEYPFYYIEYGIAQLGALQIWVRAQQVGRRALDDYRNALALGGSRPLPELFRAAGINLDFSEDTIASLMDAVTEALAEL